MFWDSRTPGEDQSVFLITETGSFSYKEVFDQGDALFQNTERGVLALLCDKSVETITAYVGALRCNVVPMLLDSALSSSTLSGVLEAYVPEYLFARYDREFPGYSVLERLDEYVLFYRNQVDEQNSLFDGLKLLVPTSGSTGDPKAVRLSAKNLQSCTEAVCRYLKMETSRRSVSLLPLQYSYGLSVLHNTMQVRAGYLVTDLTILDRGLWDLLVRFGVTDLSGVPFMFETLRRMPFSQELLDTLRCVTQAGGHLNPKITRHFVDLFATHSIAYYTMYGQTEASPRISYLPPDLAHSKTGSVGQPLDCGTMEIQDPDRETGEGELIYKGDNVSLGYAHSREDLDKGDEFGGVLATGDLARLDQDGFAYITGRKKRMVKIHGVSVNLDHLERTLNGSGIRCMVIGRDNRLVVCHEPDREGALQSMASETFNFHPSVWSYKTEEMLPLNSSGKPDYPALSGRYL